MKFKSRPIGLAALLSSSILLSGYPHAQENTLPNNLSSDEIAAQLLAPTPTSMTRRFQPRANPDANTRVCDPEMNQMLTRSTGKRGEELTRTLVPEAAPKVDLFINFQLGEAKILPQAARQLDELAQVLNRPTFANERFAISGHTDQIGNADYNDKLSCERALSVKRYLAAQHRIAPERLIPLGFGFAQLRDPENPTGAANRRVEIRRFEARP